MNKQRMRGVIDPISAAFLLAIIGTVTAITLDGKNEMHQSESGSGKPATEAVAVNQTKTN